MLCTPAAAKSRWVNKECETFINLGREGRIFPVIAAGEPDSAAPDLECFPSSIRGKGLLAADLRQVKLQTGQLIGDGREGGRLKLIAGLLGVPLDSLAQRERVRQRTLIAGLSTAAIVFAGVAIAAVWRGCWPMPTPYVRRRDLILRHSGETLKNGCRVVHPMRFVSLCGRSAWTNHFSRCQHFMQRLLRRRHL